MRTYITEKIVETNMCTYTVNKLFPTQYYMTHILLLFYQNV